jgi:hypothetical protein
MRDARIVAREVMHRSRRYVVSSGGGGVRYIVDPDLILPLIASAIDAARKEALEEAARRVLDVKGLTIFWREEVADVVREITQSPFERLREIAKEQGQKQRDSQAALGRDPLPVEASAARDCRGGFEG